MLDKWGLISKPQRVKMHVGYDDRFNISLIVLTADFDFFPYYKDKRAYKVQKVREESTA